MQPRRGKQFKLQGNVVNVTTTTNWDCYNQGELEHTHSDISSKVNVEDNWSEDEEKIPAGVTETVLTSTDFLEDSERQDILNVVPAEGNRPLIIFRDKCCEELAYPSIFVGMKRPEIKERKVKVQYSNLCKSEVRRSDRRAAMCLENIFFKA